MSIRLLTIWRANGLTIHTAVDDLESFLWLLSWALVHILKEYGGKHPDILYLENALSSKDMGSNLTKEYFIGRSWLNVAFGKLTQDWLKILTLARYEVKQFIDRKSVV